MGGTGAERERERQRDKQTQRQRDKERKRERVIKLDKSYCLTRPVFRALEADETKSGSRAGKESGFDVSRL